MKISASLTAEIGFPSLTELIDEISTDGFVHCAAGRLDTQLIDRSDPLAVFQRVFIARRGSATLAGVGSGSTVR